MHASICPSTCVIGPIYWGYIPFHAAESEDSFLAQWVLFVRKNFFEEIEVAHFFLPRVQRISHLLLNQTQIAGFEHERFSDCTSRPGCMDTLFLHKNATTKLLTLIFYSFFIFLLKFTMTLSLLVLVHI